MDGISLKLRAYLTKVCRLTLAWPLGFQIPPLSGNVWWGIKCKQHHFSEARSPYICQTIRHSLPLTLFNPLWRTTAKAVLMHHVLSHWCRLVLQAGIISNLFCSSWWLLQEKPKGSLLKKHTEFPWENLNFFCIFTCKGKVKKNHIFVRFILKMATSSLSVKTF